MTSREQLLAATFVDLADTLVAGARPDPPGHD
jgi:hypothetical protein